MTTISDGKIDLTRAPRRICILDPDGGCYDVPPEDRREIERKLGTIAPARKGLGDQITLEADDLADYWYRG